MRNFKKFLALVLAMLMVSACAVSVSAAYADQDKISADYEKAVNTLTNLGVISGDGVNFDPTGTLTRAQAAKIIAMLVTGSGIQATNNSKSTFSDVPADHWGIPYINYVSQRGIMDGIGGGKFDPDADLTIAEAITLAVKAAGLKGEVAKYNEQFGVPSFWAANWIAVADAAYLTDVLPKYLDYTADCTREMFTQIGYNLFIHVADIKEEFDLEDPTAVIESVTDKVVSLEGVKDTFTVDVFNAALKAAGIDKTAAELVDNMVTVIYSVDNNVIYDIILESDAVPFDYKSGLIDYAKDANNNNAVITTQIKLDGTVYEFGVDPEKAEDKKPASVGGTVDASKSKVEIFKDGADVAVDAINDKFIPDFFKGVAYDDDKDGDFDRVLFNTYDIALIKDGGLVDHDGKNDTAKVQATVIDYFSTAKADQTLYSATITAGVAYSNFAPALVCVTGTAVDVLETGVAVPGVVSNISSSYIKVGGTDYSFAPVYVPVVDDKTAATDIIGQTITIYTINGEYVNYVSGISSVNVLVDNVTIENGAAVVSGYEVAINSDKKLVLAPITLTVIGAEDESGRLQSKVADRYNDAYTGNDKTDIDYNMDGKFTADDNKYSRVALGKNENNKFVAEYYFDDMTYYTFKVNAEGKAYYAGRGDDVLADLLFGKTASPSKTLALDGTYINEGSGDNVAAIYKLAASCAVIYETTTAPTKNVAYDAYATTSLKVDTKLPAFKSLNYYPLNAAGTVVDRSEAIKDGNAIAFIYIDSFEKPDAPTSQTIKDLAAGTTIVRINELDSYTLTDNVYKATDIFTGKDVLVTYAGTAEAGDFAEIDANNKVTALDTKWMGTNTIYAAKNGEFVTGYYTYDTNLTATTAGVVTGRVITADKITVGVNVTVWTIKDNKLTAVTDYTVAAGDFYGFASGNQIVIIK